MYKQSGLPANALHRHLQAGQILLIIILVTIVASTIGLSLASKSIINLRTSTEEAESQKALAAAEAGIERAIQSSVPISVSNINVIGSEGKTNSAYNTEVQSVQSTAFLINGGNLIPKDEGADVWFVDHNSDGSLDYSKVKTPQHLTLYWGTSSEGCESSPAALEVILISKDKSSRQINSYRYAYDGCSRDNNFTTADSGGVFNDGVKTVNFGYSTPLDHLGNGKKDLVLMRVIPVYKDTIAAVDAGNTSLPSQGYTITSTGTSGQASRKLNVFKGWPQTYLPYLSYGLFVANN